MEVYRPRHESYTCECGGRKSDTPEIFSRHGKTYKHQTWEFNRLCLELLKAETYKQKIPLLIEMRKLVRTGRVR